MELREELEEQKREISKISSLHFAILSEVNAAKRCLVRRPRRSRTSRAPNQPRDYHPVVLDLDSPWYDNPSLTPILKFDP